MSRPSKAMAAKVAPPKNVVAAPYASHNQPATPLASSIATPLARLKKPKAVPRKSAGAVSATMVVKSPCVMPMWMPQRATPASSVVQCALLASTRSEAISTAKPMARSVEWRIRSDSLPKG